MKFDEGWTTFFASQISVPGFKGAAAYVQNQRKAGITVYPPEGKVFEAFSKTPFGSLKAVIMIDEHYTAAENAGHGLALSVDKDKNIPPTLMNVFYELHRDLGVPIPSDGDLTGWAEAGILLLTNNITARENKTNSHAGVGWRMFTENLIRYISDNKDHVVFAFWGDSSRKNSKYINKEKHLVLTSSDPARPYEGFSGCGHFSEINKVCSLWEPTSE